MKHLPIFFLLFIITSATHNATINNTVEEYKKLAHIAIKKQHYDHALSYYRNALALEPNNNILHVEFGNVLKELGHLEEAIDHLLYAIKLDPSNLNTHLNLANILTLAEQPEQALAHYQKVLRYNPKVAQILYNYGFALKKSGYIIDALKIYEHVLALDPAYQHAHFSRGLAYLSLGDFARGWPEYEWRRTTTQKQQAFFTDKKKWDGTQDLTNKTILLVAEQGLGDTFQFIRYAQLIKKMYPCTIICQVQPALTKILSACPYIDVLISHNDQVTDYPFDYYSLLLSLPHCCNTTLETIPTSIPYIWADPLLIQAWKNKLASDTGFKIGICWQGNTQYVSVELQRAVAAKSVTPKYFAPLAKIDGISLYSLQKIDTAHSAKTAPFALHFFDTTFDQNNGRFADTAAVMKNLDLIITVDTSIAHCAGALGVPVWVLLPYPADWRWMLDRTDSPWYPTMRLFRQKHRGDWNAVFIEVATALSQLITM